jgi:hypothetical protein
VADQRPGIEVPDSGNFVAIQVELRRFRGTPVGRNLRKLPYNQRFDVRPRSFFVIKIRADISDVRIGQANDLARVAGIGENFLVTGEAGIKNDFAAAARNGAGCTPVKYASVLERKNRRSVLNFVQRSLRSRTF